MTYKKDTTQQMTIGKQYTYEKLKKFAEIEIEIGSRKEMEEKYPKSCKCNRIITDWYHHEQIEQTPKQILQWASN